MASETTQALYDLCTQRRRPSELPTGLWNTIPLSSRLNRTTLLLRQQLPPGPWDASLRDATERASAKLRLVAAGIPIVESLCRTNGWDWLAFKTAWHFPKEMSDVDILLAGNVDLAAVGEAVVAIRGTIVEREAHKLKVYVPAGDGQVATLDFHTKITQDDLDFFDEARVLQDRVEGTIEGHRAVVPSSEDEVLALCLEAYFGDSILNLAVVLEVTTRFGEPGFDPGLLRALARERNWAEEVESVLFAIDCVHRSCGGKHFELSTGIGGPRGRAIQRTFGRSKTKLPGFFPLSWVARDLLAKGRSDKARGDTRAPARALHAIRRQAGARLYGIPMKVDGVVVKVP